MVSLESHSKLMAKKRQELRARILITVGRREGSLQLSRASVLLEPWEPCHVLAIVLWVPWDAGWRIPSQTAPQPGHGSLCDHTVDAAGLA